MSKIEREKPGSMTPFFVLWGGQAVSLLGSAMVQFALVWWITEQTGSGTSLSIAILMGFIPQVVLGPLIGPLIDRWPRRQILLWADVVISAASLLLMGLFLAEVVLLWHVYAILFIRALGGAFHQPTMIATTPLMVPDEQLTRVNSLNQMLGGAVSIVAGPLGALLLIWVSEAGILILDVITAGFAIVPLFLIAIPEIRKEPSSGTDLEGESAGILSEIREGLNVITGHAGLFALVMCAALTNFLFAPLPALLPLWVLDHFNGDSFLFGIFQASAGVGILIGGLILSAWGGFKSRIQTIVVGFLILGVFIAAAAFVPASLPWLGLATVLVAIGSTALINAPIMAIIQSVVPAELQGRVFTLLGSLATVAAPLGLLIVGPFSDQFGPRPWFVIAGLVAFGVGLWILFLPSTRHIEDTVSLSVEKSSLAIEAEETVGAID